MTTILALDTSTEACSAALLCNGTYTHAYRKVPRKHADLLLPMIEQLLSEAGITVSALDAVAVCTGPGSFTGIRIATSVAQGLCYAHNLPAVAVSSLETQVLQVWDNTDAKMVFSCIDARINELYWAVFSREDGSPVCLTGERLSPPAEITRNDLKTDELLFAAGSGLRYLDQMSADLQKKITGTDETLLPHAAAVLKLGLNKFLNGEYCAARDLEPVYLRNQVARKPGAPEL